MRLLAFGLSPAEVAAEVSRGRPPAERISIEDLRAIAADAAGLTRDKRLSAPAQAGFLGRHPLETSQLDGLLSLATELLDVYVKDPSEARVPSKPSPETPGRLALEYVEGLLIQEHLSQTRSESPLRAALDEMDQRRVDEVLLYKSMMGPPKTLEHWLSRWKSLNDALERNPESVMFEEYENWLIARDGLEEALSVLTPPSHATLAARVGPLDLRFFRATRAVSTSIRPRERWAPQSWWWFRVPRRMGKSFKDYLNHFVPLVAREVSATPNAECDRAPADP